MVKKRLTLELEEDTIRLFKSIAIMQKKTMKEVIEEAIKKYIRENAKVVAGGITASEVVKGN